MTAATAERCRHGWTSSHTAAGWREHSCVRPAGHADACRCGCGATTTRPEGEQ